MEEIVVLRTNAESGNLLLHDNALFYIKPETEFLSLSLGYSDLLLARLRKKEGKQCQLEVMLVS